MIQRLNGGINGSVPAGLAAHAGPGDEQEQEGRQPLEQGGENQQLAGDAQQQPGIEQYEGRPPGTLIAAHFGSGKDGEHPVGDAEDHLRDPAGHEQVQIDGAEDG